MNKNETIVALSTPNGSGAIAIIRMSGDKALQILLNIFKRKNAKRFMTDFAYLPKESLAKYENFLDRLSQGKVPRLKATEIKTRSEEMQRILEIYPIIEGEEIRCQLRLYGDKKMEAVIFDDSPATTPRVLSRLKSLSDLVFFQNL